MTVYYKETQEQPRERVAGPTQTNAKCKRCVKPMSGVGGTMCNHLAECPQRTEEEKQFWKEKKRQYAPNKRRKRNEQISDHPVNELFNLPPLSNHNQVAAPHSRHNSSNNNNNNNNINAIALHSIQQHQNHSNPPPLSIEQTQLADQMCAEWIINRPHIPFTEATNEYLLSFIHSINPHYNPPNRNRISGTLLTAYADRLKKESKEVII